MDYQQCNRCVMDTTAENIFFDSKGNCNFCEELLNRIINTPKVTTLNLNNFVNKIRKSGEGKPYDCIVGVSGGVDSAYTLYLVKKLGLRPLAVHMDNGWNSELANNNIESLIKGMNVDFYAHVIDWNEYKQLMEAFFKANVIDIELLYDNAMFAVNYQLASKYGIKYILSGSNSTSEGMMMPSNWNWLKMDKKNIKKIANKGKVKIKTFPIIGTIEYLYYRVCKKVQWVPFLDYFDYNKMNAMNFLKENFGFKPYEYKHYESVFTRFYQGYLLPTKFNVDKRKLHLSSLICSHQITREQALENLNFMPYNSAENLESDKEYFLKKMGWSEDKLNEYLIQKEVPHSAYGSEKELWNFCLKTYKALIK